MGAGDDCFGTAALVNLQLPPCVNTSSALRKVCLAPAPGQNVGKVKREKHVCRLRAARWLRDPRIGKLRHCFLLPPGGMG